MSACISNITSVIKIRIKGHDSQDENVAFDIRPLNERGASMTATKDQTLWNLKLMILKKGFRQYEISQALGKDATWLSKVVHGCRTSTEAEQAQIAQILGADPNHLFQAS